MVARTHAAACTADSAPRALRLALHGAKGHVGRAEDARVVPQLGGLDGALRARGEGARREPLAQGVENRAHPPTLRLRSRRPPGRPRRRRSADRGRGSPRSYRSRRAPRHRRSARRRTPSASRSGRRLDGLDPRPLARAQVVAHRAADASARGTRACRSRRCAPRPGHTHVADLPAGSERAVDDVAVHHHAAAQTGSYGHHDHAAMARALPRHSSPMAAALASLT